MPPLRGWKDMRTAYLQESGFGAEVAPVPIRSAESGTSVPKESEVEFMGAEEIANLKTLVAQGGDLGVRASEVLMKAENQPRDPDGRFASEGVSAAHDAITSKVNETLGSYSYTGAAGTHLEDARSALNEAAATKASGGSARSAYNAAGDSLNRAADSVAHEGRSDGLRVAASLAYHAAGLEPKNPRSSSMSQPVAGSANGGDGTASGWYSR